MAPAIGRWLGAVLTSVALVAAVTAAIALLEPGVPALGLGVLYLMAVVPIALIYGAAVADLVAVGSMAAFSYMFLPPRFSFDPGTSEQWSVIVAFLVSSVVVAQFAARSQREARRSARLADEQAALRRVATLVARTDSTSEIFEAVTREVGLLSGADRVRVERHESDGTVTTVAGWSREGEEPQIRSSVSCPIAVGGRTWGTIAAASRSEAPFTAGTESQISEFTELVATAVANAQARDESLRLTNEQAALRRVARLVARAAPLADVFTAVADELAGLLDVDAAMIARVDPDGMMTVVARCGGGDEETAMASRWTLEQPMIVARLVQTGRSVRVDGDGDNGDSVATPVFVAGRLWGAIIIARQGGQLEADAEQRSVDLTELVATAITNADARDELVASRARLLTAGDDARRRIVRDLHDGAQQRLVQTIITIKLARRAQQHDDESVDELIVDALEQAEQANDELRELAHGLLPPVLASGGLRAAVQVLVSRLRVPVEVAVPRERLPVEIEASAYFVIAEALTNVVKHSRAERAQIEAWIEGSALHVDVRDDGVGGAREDGTGLLGLQDRLAALGGRLRVESPPDGGTRIAATLPL